jgi:hypothetical protein
MLISNVYYWLKGATTVAHLTEHKDEWIEKVAKKYEIHVSNAKHQVELTIVHYHIDNIEDSDVVDPKALAYVLRSLAPK